MASSTEEVSVAPGDANNDRTADDMTSSEKQFAVFKDFDFLEYELESQGVRLTSMVLLFSCLLSQTQFFFILYKFYLFLFIMVKKFMFQELVICVTVIREETLIILISQHHTFLTHLHHLTGRECGQLQPVGGEAPLPK